MRIVNIFVLLLLLFISTQTLQAQSQVKSSAQENIVTVEPNSKPTIFRIAGDYSEDHDVLTIAILRGTAYSDDYDIYVERLSFKLDSMGVPHRIFQEFNENKGTIFDYFIENYANGSFNARELTALLPHIRREYLTAYKNKKQP